MLSFATLDRSLKIERNAVNNFSSKTQLVSLKLPALEKLIQERSLVALSISESRNESCDVIRLLDRHLHKFAFFQKRVHPRIRLPALRALFRRRRRFRRNTQQSQRQHRCSNKDEPIFFHDTARPNRTPRSPPHQVRE